MIRAYHAIFTAYGFWLPNDPRGSWSEFVGSWEIFRYGAPLPAGTRFSRARVEHDFRKRMAAKNALLYPPVVFNGIQARAIGQGFSKAVELSGYRILACALMPDHVHVVIRRHAQDVERIVGHLKGRASKRMQETGVHPLSRFQKKDHIPSPWAEGCWKVFLDGAADIERAVGYVEANPPKEGLRPQEWYFLEHRLPLRKADPNGG